MTAWNIFRQFGPGMINRQFTGKAVYWGIDFKTMEYAFRLNRISKSDRPDLLRKIIACIEQAVEEEVKENG